MSELLIVTWKPLSRINYFAILNDKYTQLK